MTDTETPNVLTLEINGNEGVTLRTVAFGLKPDEVNVLLVLTESGSVGLTTDAPIQSYSAEDIRDFGEMVRNIGSLVMENADGIAASEQDA